MNQHLRDVLQRVDTWPPQAQQELAHAALAIERSLDTMSNRDTQPTLRQIMQASPLHDMDLERQSTTPQVRDVNL